jgi:hypothetical protein
MSRSLRPTHFYSLRQSDNNKKGDGIMPNFEYLYSVKGDFSMDGTQVYLHPENFINFLGRYRYHDKMFPVI